MAGPFETIDIQNTLDTREVKEDAASKKMLETLKNQIKKEVNLPKFKKEEKFKNPALMTEEELQREQILHAKTDTKKVESKNTQTENKAEKKGEQVEPMYLTNQIVIDRANYIIKAGKKSFADTYGDTRPGGFGGQSVLKYSKTDIKRIDEMVTYLKNKKYSEQNNANLGPVTTKENPTYTGENVKDVMYGPDVITKNVLEAIKDVNVLKNTYHVERRFENDKNMYYPIAGYEWVYPDVNDNYNTKKIEKTIPVNPAYTGGNVNNIINPQPATPNKPKQTTNNNTNLGPVKAKQNPTLTGENVKDVMYGPDVITKNVLEAIKDVNVLKNTYHVERRFENGKNMYYPIAGYEWAYPNLNDNYNTKKIETTPRVTPINPAYTGKNVNNIINPQPTTPNKPTITQQNKPGISYGGGSGVKSPQQ